ncbi:hypothetical protein A8C50_05085 [Ligilactobacillus salivarius]|uniref:Uncharacterized protein n=1 Tax=Ligilactobacillus salivarius TaxID=1624 RepID=A0A9X6XJC1_9LACO|nr:hypothetical protein A8C38_05915 [Ligilactobacillus salivarius]PAY27855.1 hypothetical protein A8C33_05390 [Ligilactobacillus salivarius]PAY29235.1 hypothetical protein A8C44_01930 [Ligilactobacillus salivarius]PAY30016.1 hypothetical protein A8C49_05285 [Ligilactobacillus salivarius]PAY36611.1 hypothetical protein A8C50_05085 [Ligilactobacillus salivarius]
MRAFYYAKKDRYFYLSSTVINYFSLRLPKAPSPNKDPSLTRTAPTVVPLLCFSPVCGNSVVANLGCALACGLALALASTLGAT